MKVKLRLHMAHCALLVSIDLPPRIELQTIFRSRNNYVQHGEIFQWHILSYIYNFKIQKHKVWFEKQQLTPVINLAKNQIILDELQI